MVKVEVTKDCISLLGHANFADYGEDIVCASISSIVMTTVEGIAKIDELAIDIKQTDNHDPYERQQKSRHDLIQSP